jgi:uncharacterized membrane protein YesL
MRTVVEERDAGHTSSLPVWVGKAVWSNLPLLLAMDAVLFVGAVPAVALFFGGSFVLAPLVGILTLGPLWAGTIASTDCMIRDEAVSLRTFANKVRRHAGHGVKVSVIPAIVITTILGTLVILEARPDAQWIFIPLLVDASVLILVLLAGLSAFSLVTTGGLKGLTLWRTSIQVVAADPMTTLGTVAVLVILALLASRIPGLLLLLPAPLAIYLSASTWLTIWRLEDAAKNERYPVSGRHHDERGGRR